MQSPGGHDGTFLMAHDDLDAAGYEFVYPFELRNIPGAADKPDTRRSEVAAEQLGLEQGRVLLDPSHRSGSNHCSADSAGVPLVT